MLAHFRAMYVAEKGAVGHCNLCLVEGVREGKKCGALTLALAAVKGEGRWRQPVGAGAAWLACLADQRRKRVNWLVLPSSQHFRVLSSRGEFRGVWLPE